MRRALGIEIVDGAVWVGDAERDAGIEHLVLVEADMRVQLVAQAGGDAYVTGTTAVGIDVSAKLAAGMPSRSCHG